MRKEKERERETDRQTNRRTNEQTDRQSRPDEKPPFSAKPVKGMKFVRDRIPVVSDVAW